MTYGDQRKVEIAGEIRGETRSGLAWEFFDGTRVVFLPKSLTRDLGDGTFEIPEWLAKKEELI